MGFWKSLFGESFLPGKIDIYSFASDFNYQYENEYIILKADINDDKIVKLNMVKVVKKEPISEITINIDSEADNFLSNKTQLNVSNEIQMYEIFMNFSENLKFSHIIVQSKWVIEKIKEKLEKYGYSGTIYYYLIRDIIYNYEFKSEKIEDLFVKMGLYYNFFIDENEFRESSKTILELQVELINYILDEKKKENEELIKYEMYIYMFIKKMILDAKRSLFEKIRDLRLRIVNIKTSKEASICFKTYNGFHEIIKFKIENGQKYFIVSEKDAQNIDLIKTTSEDNNVKVWFDTIEDIYRLKNYLIKIIEFPYVKEKIAFNGDFFDVDILELNKNLDENIKKEIDALENIKYTINPVHNRIELYRRKKHLNWYTHYLEGHSYWLAGEKYRKERKFKDAVEQYDNARYCRYEQLNLYKSYAKAYHELKDYDNEICILNEGIEIVKGNIDSLKNLKLEAFKLALEQKNKNDILKKEKEEEEHKKYIEKLKIETAERKKKEEEQKIKRKEKKIEEKKIYDKLRKEVISKIIKNANVCLLYRDCIKDNFIINKKIDKLKLNNTFEELLWDNLIRIYENKVIPNKIGRFYNQNCFKDTNILKDKYINEYILNYFSKNKQDKSYYEIFEKREKELEKENKKLDELKQSTSIIYYIEFFSKIIMRCIELIDVVDVFDNDEELNKMYRNLITVTDDVKYITEKIYPIYKKCYASKMNIKVSKIDLEIVLYLKRKLADEIDIKITQKNKRQTIIKIMMENYGKVLKKEENKFIYVLINLIAHQNDDIDEYINILKKVDDIIENVNEKIALNEAEQEKERILSGDLRKEVTLNRLKMTYASVTSPAEFEQYVADLYERLGYTIDEVVDKNKRGGADIIAFKDDIKYVIQVKYYTKPVNKNGIIEVVAAKKLYKANKGIHVTNSYYSMSAMQFAVQNNIELVDGEMIEEYIKEISQKNNK